MLHQMNNLAALAQLYEAEVHLEARVSHSPSHSPSIGH